MPRLNQPFPRWVPGEGLAEITAWGIFLALSLAHGSGYAITRALVPLQAWPCAPSAQVSGICCLQWHFLLALEFPWSTCRALGTTEVSPRPGTPFSADSSIHGSDQMSAPFWMTTPFAELLQDFIDLSGRHGSLSKTLINL